MEEKTAEEEKVAAAAEEENEPKSSLFPLFSLPDASQETTPSVPQWLSNSSFNTDLSIINDSVASQLDLSTTQIEQEQEEAEDEDDDKRTQRKPSSSYEILESSGSDRDSESEKREKKRRKKKKRKRRGSDDRGGVDYGSRKSRVRAWADAESNAAKDYYIDSHGDRDNLAFGCIYRMDLARYKPYNSSSVSGFDAQGLYRQNLRNSVLDRDSDTDALDSKLRSAGRYWSAKYTALERHKNLRRTRILAPEIPTVTNPEDFIPLLDIQTSQGAVGSEPVSRTFVVEESWEDEVLHKTRDFNKLTREHPHEEKFWLSFAEFQDKVADMQPQKGARVQTLEKKISILEKAVELNPDNEELLFCLLKAYKRRDSTDVLIGRWEKILLQHSGNYKLWREFLCVVQGEFSRFKVSDMRKMYAHAIHALSASSGKHFRQVQQNADTTSMDPVTINLELGLVDIFVSLCRFEWQAGHQELATALFQAEIEFSLFSPSLFLTEQSKQRLFEHFWSSHGARVGEEGALGWSTWLEKEEENRQRVIKEEAPDDNEQGGWTGWSEPLSRGKESSSTLDDEANNDLAAEESKEEAENVDSNQEDDTETLLKMLGIDVDAGVGGEVNDTTTWIRWSEEESSRDCDQWMPVRRRSDGASSNGGTSDLEEDGHLLRDVLYEDVSEFLFSLSSVEARLSLVFQFIDFYGGQISQLFCTNSSSWTEKLRSLEALPDSLLQKLKLVHDVLTRTDSSSTGLSLEYLLGHVSKSTDMMKFLRNSTLLCLTVFPRNHILEEAILVAEELYVTKSKSSSCMDTPCRALAKSLLKNDRQDILLCGVYARREADYGNLGHARKVFDMALLSIEGLSVELQFRAPLLYFWYAEAEFANNFDSDDGRESISRAIHILSCLGSGVKFSPYKCQPSSLQLLRAHQGFKEKIRILRSTWARGVVDDQSVALVCSAALYEELTSGWAMGVEVMNQAFEMVLPGRRSHSRQLEFMFNFYIRMLRRHQNQSSLSKVLESISQGIEIYPFSPALFNALIQTGQLYTTSNKLRWMLDGYCQKKPSVVIWLFALSFEMSRGGSKHRIRRLFEKALANDKLCNSVILWRCYIAYEINAANSPSAARRIFFRAIHACPWSKKLWLDGFLKLNSVLTAKELSDLQEVMRDKELNLRTDIYEILLKDELVS
ncbi:protein NRDE2-like isoform X1 [Quillaja saponaria]|uniref:Protein NRDE2-like isoform X1 n=1 Tax=Quillaja saponaria TaxID=32244 RepID=A0AAD7VH62_QUISA|nr:protein NRDE2-like isoform X1 [Quillaja saponaria]